MFDRILRKFGAYQGSRGHSGIVEDSQEHSVSVSNSPKSDKADQNDIYYCFRLILGREPNPEEIAGHYSKAGQDLTAVVSTYLNSLEFANRRLIGTQRNASYTLAEMGKWSLMVDASDEDVGKHILAGQYEPHVTSVFESTLRPGMRVIDIGANIGYFSMLAAGLVGAEGSVVAFEPNPDNARMLEFSRRKNGFDHIRLYQTAASDTDGILVLNSTYSNGTTSQPSEDVEALLAARTVPCLQLDQVLLAGARVDFIKIDIEGAEYRALKGAEALLQRDRPTIVSEFSPNAMPGISGVDGSAYLRFLMDMGYSIDVLLEDGKHLSCEDAEQVMNAYARSGVDHIDFVASVKI